MARVNPLDTDHGFSPSDERRGEVHQAVVAAVLGDINHWIERARSSPEVAPAEELAARLGYPAPLIEEVLRTLEGPRGPLARGASGGRMLRPDMEFFLRSRAS